MSSTTRQVVINRGLRNSPSRKRNQYRTRSYNSEVDETLFGSPARYSDQKDTPRICPEDVSWDPPWVTSPKKTGAPLLWSPFDSKDSESVNSARKSTRSTTPRRPTSAKNKYRLRKQTPSYVDETLFATPRKAHEAQAPWATEDTTSPNKNRSQVTWSPPLEGANPGTPINAKKIELKSNAEEDGRMHYTPIIKPRLGSTINTPQSEGRSQRTQRKENTSSASSVQQKLDFCIENGANNASEEHDPDAIVRRALKLAGIARHAEQQRRRSNSLDGLSSRASTPGRYFWKRPTSPASSTGRPATIQTGSSAFSTSGKRGTQVDDLFSATGTRVPLSARDSPRRPNSARTSKSDIDVPGLDFNPPRLYGSRTPRSARSGTSAQSALLSRPSWKP